ncbi:MAG: hypothetical protein IAE82_14650 [Opitutaceae bacterium]|nr:hypothetical protein [Opitutaceae bacterium]
MPDRRSILLVTLFLVSLLAPGARGADALPLVSPIFGDHMVLQRDTPNRIWGWTRPGAEVRVQVGATAVHATAAADGRWLVEFSPPPVGGPYEVRVDGADAASLTLHDVLVGDVWLCGGQSNMEFGLKRAKGGPREVAQADHPRIRFFRVAAQPAYAPAKLVSGDWKVCAPSTFGADYDFSAVAYFFARRLQQDVDVPIGLIQDAVGGTPAETWTSAAGLSEFSEFAPGLAEIERLRGRDGPVYGNYIMHWYDDYDVGLKGDWAAEAFDDGAWANTSLKAGFVRLGVAATPAVVWFRREIVLPDPLPAGTARLQLGVVEKMDTAHINGRWIGASAWVENPRNYAIPDGVLRPGKNSVALRVLKLKPDGGFTSEAEKLRLLLGDGTVVALEGDDAWRAALSVDARPPHPLPLGYDNWPTMPAVLNLGMIQPVAPLALKGMLWYQGEANFTRAHQYRTLLPAMIADWRASFGQGNLPFLIAQLPAFQARKVEPGDDWWAELRDAQALVARTVPGAALAVTVDTGDADDIHPTDKVPVGERLALAALRDVYGRDLAASGPTFASLESLPGALRIHFAHTDGGFVVQGERLGEFAIAGADRKWAWAEARIEGDAVVVSSPQVPEPVAVRYAWQANPLATLFNGAGLPAAPFRTDDWPLSTEGRK